MIKVSEWLSELSSHHVYDAEQLERDFNEKTGGKACWPTYTNEEIAGMIAERGLGGTLAPDTGARLANGWEIAIALARAILKRDPSGIVEGRGSRFRLCLEALGTAGH